MPRPRRHKITDPDQLLAISSPIRAKIVTILENRNEYSVREIAEELGMRVESIYYHVHQLVNAGLLVRTRQRPATTRSEAAYRLLARQICVDWKNTAPPYRSALKKAVRVAHRLSERVMEEALDNRDCSFGGMKAGARVQQESVRLSRAKFRELLGKLQEIERFIMENNDPNEATTYLLTAAAAPLARRSPVK